MLKVQISNAELFSNLVKISNASKETSSALSKFPYFNSKLES